MAFRYITAQGISMSDKMQMCNKHWNSETHPYISVACFPANFYVDDCT